MERYKTRDGVVLTTVCGEILLVAASALRELCPFVTVVNDSSAFLWQRLKMGATLEELEQAVKDEYEIDDPAMVKGVIKDFVNQMLELHYLAVNPASEKGFRCFCR